MQQRLLLSQPGFTSSFVFCGETESVPRKMGIQEREILTNPKEGTDDTVVHPVNLSYVVPGYNSALTFQKGAKLKSLQKQQ